MKDRVLIYGANGYSAGLIIQQALAAGAKPILAGRSAEKIAPLCQKLGLPLRAFSLDNPQAVAKNLVDVAVVLNCAGPFSRTARPMVEGCLRARTHYLDITGEFDVFEALAALGAQAQAAGVMLMPGVGFDVVPSDCLAVHLKNRLPDARSLTLAIKGIEWPSHGTATTMVEGLDRGGVIRRGGRVVAVPPAWATRDVNFGDGPVPTISIPWGDVSTAWVSTGIGDIEVFFAAPSAVRWMAKAARYGGFLLRSNFVQTRLKRQIDAAPAGPTAEQRRKSRSHFWGEVRNARGQSAAARLDTVDGYTLTALTAWDIAKRVTEGEMQPGFRTPAMVFGADYILNFAGARRIDL